MTRDICPPCACGCGELTMDRRSEYRRGHRPLDPLGERLRAHLAETDSGCIEWRGTLGADGYGQAWNEGRRIRAHRAAWEVANGPIPEGMHVLHRCDNPPCCNIEHLFLGDHSDNMRDMSRKGRWGNGVSKLTDQKVREMRAMRAAGALQRDIATAFGVSAPHVSEILAGKYWRAS